MLEPQTGLRNSFRHLAAQSAKKVRGEGIRYSAQADFFRINNSRA